MRANTQQGENTLWENIAFQRRVGHFMAGERKDKQFKNAHEKWQQRKLDRHAVRELQLDWK